MAKISSAGIKDNSSDCWIRLEIQKSGGIQVEQQSKVQSMYGRSISQTISRMLEFYEIRNAHLTIHDSGALPFVLCARIEAAVKECFPDKHEDYLSPIHPNNVFSVDKFRLRRSRLYVPGDQAKLIINAGLFKPDGIILDLEDAVAPSEKKSARFLVRNALREVDFFQVERMVRINQLPMGLEDLNCIVPHGVHTVLIPKCEQAETVRDVEARIQELQTKYKTKNPIFLLPIIESALGVINAYSIATASTSTVALTIGLEDFTADIGAERTLEGRESFFARSEIVTAARAAGIQPIDSVFSDVGDEAGLQASVAEAKTLGFEGKGCIHPSQIPIVHAGFAPSEGEISKAKRIILAMKAAREKGSGVVSLGTKMIDPPVVKRAERVLKLAIRNHQIPANWIKKEN
ncbi:MAG: aldolase/citrate lyase family protein [Candidatus Aminicenantes bacterium]|nr:aldolase/citrate lyase family protein [Candidatus Aminicenantes bacterium]